MMPRNHRDKARRESLEGLLAESLVDEMPQHVDAARRQGLDEFERRIASENADARRGWSPFLRSPRLPLLALAAAGTAVIGLLVVPMTPELGRGTVQLTAAPAQPSALALASQSYPLLATRRQAAVTDSGWRAD